MGLERTYVPLESYPEAQERPGIKVYKVTGYLWFGNATKMRDQTYAFMADAAKHDKGTGGRRVDGREEGENKECCAIHRLGNAKF